MPKQVHPLAVVLFVAPVLIVGLAAAAQAHTTWYVDNDAPNDPGPGDPQDAGEPDVKMQHREFLDDPPLPAPAWQPRWPPLPPVVFARDGYYSVQVNVDEFGGNIPGDAANEPSIAVDPTNPNRIAIGWRQFDTVPSNFRQAGWGYSRDAGRTWTFPGVLELGVFRSDPVLDADADGRFYYYSLKQDYTCQLFKSSDGGITWTDPAFAWGGDKPWMAIDRTGGIGDGHIYAMWKGPYYTCRFTRSVDGGHTFDDPVPVPGSPWRGVVAVGPDGAVYIAGHQGAALDVFAVAKSTTVQDPDAPLDFDFAAEVDLGGIFHAYDGPNPLGLLGQVWIAADHSGGPTRGYLYVLCSVDPPGSDPLDVHIVRSTDGGLTWSDPVRINDDPLSPDAWQWFATLAVAPNGRIDVVWNDTRNSGSSHISELYYSFSTDAGETWSANVALSEPFDSWVGWPNQYKIGDYYDMVSDEVGVNLAYAATFNDEQDVYFMRIGDFDCNGNGIPDTDDIDSGTSQDVNGNGIPDECECFGDIDGDNDTDHADLGALLGASDSQPGDPHWNENADLDGNGHVGHADLGILLADWGCGM